MSFKFGNFGATFGVWSNFLTSHQVKPLFGGITSFCLGLLQQGGYGRKKLVFKAASSFLQTKERLQIFATIHFNNAGERFNDLSGFHGAFVFFGRDKKGLYPILQK